MDMAGLCVQVVPRDESKHRPLTPYQRSTLFGMGSFGEPLYAQDILRLQPVSSADGEYVETYKYVIVNMPDTMAFLPMNSAFDYIGFVPANTPDLRFVQITASSQFPERKKVLLMEGPPRRMPRRGDPDYGYGSCSGDGTVMARYFNQTTESDSIFTRQTGTLSRLASDRPSICGTGDQAPALRNLASRGNQSAGGRGNGGNETAAPEVPVRIVPGVNGLPQRVLPTLAGQRAAQLAAEAMIERRRREQLERQAEARNVRADGRRNQNPDDPNPNNEPEEPAAPDVQAAAPTAPARARYRPYLQASNDPRMWLRNETVHVNRLAEYFVNWPEMVDFSVELCRMLKYGVVVNGEMTYVENPDDIDIPMSLGGAYWYRILRAQYDLPDNINELSNANIANRATLLLRILIITNDIPRSAPVDELTLDAILTFINDFLDTVAPVGSGQPRPALNPLLSMPRVEGQPELPPQQQQQQQQVDEAPEEGGGE